MLSFFPPDVLDEIWDLIESVSEGFPTYTCCSVYAVFLYIKLVYEVSFRAMFLIASTHGGHTLGTAEVMY